MARSSAVAMPVVERATVVVIGKESAGKSQLISSLTGRRAYSSNFRGTTVSCEVFQGERNEFVDTPGVLLTSDTITTALALQKLKESETVLLVLKATQLKEDLKEMLPLIRGKRVAGVVTFWDKIPAHGRNREALEKITSQIR